MMIKSLPQQTVTPPTTSDRLRMIKQLLDISLCLVFEAGSFFRMIFRLCFKDFRKSCVVYKMTMKETSEAERESRFSVEGKRE